MNRNRALKKLIFYQERIFQKFLPVNVYSLFLKKEPPEILVRVDDFPHWEKNFEDFLEFDRIMENNGVSYVLGVTPFLSKNPKDPDNNRFEKLTKGEISFLKKAQKEGRIRIAMHGVTHQTSVKKNNAEFKGKSKQEIEKEIKEAKDYLENKGLGTEIFIPPFNEISKKDFEAIKKYFRTIMTGPETIKDFGKKGISKIGKTLYIPSYFPYYYRPRKQKFPPLKGKRVLALHWTAFKSKKELRKLIKYIKPFSVNYEEFIKNFEKKGK